MSTYQGLDKGRRRRATAQQIDPVAPWGEVVEVLVLLPLAAVVIVQVLSRL